MILPKPRPADDPRNGPVHLRKTLLAQGHDDRSIARLVANGVLVRVRRGAYADRASVAGLDADGRHGLRARAVVQQARTRVVLSHVSGLPEYDAPTWGLDLSTVHVTRTDAKAGRREAGVQQHKGAVLPGDVVELNGLEVMSPTRLALEATTLGTSESGLVVVNDLLHRCLTTKAELLARYALMERWPYTLRTTLVLQWADRRIETVGESRTWHLIRRSALPVPEPQYVVRDAWGREVARVDFAWPEFGVFLEFDGKVKYEKLLLPGQSASQVVVAEKRREELVCRLTGWRCVRVVWDDLARPAATQQLIRDALFRPSLAA